MNWGSLIDGQALARLLPAEYSDLAVPIRDALTVFLAGLPETEQGLLLAEQASLSPAASLSRRLGVLARRCPVLHKLGQVLARDRRLALELREQLWELESLPPSVPLSAIEETLQRELGSLHRLGLELVPPALAEASVAVVIPCRAREVATADAGNSRDEGCRNEGVLKILKPGIERRLEMELGLLDRVGAHLDERCQELGIPQLDYQQTFQQVRDKLLEEILLDREQQHLRVARELYAGDAAVQIPEVWPYCTPRVTAMERVWGKKVTDGALESGTRRRLARQIVAALVARPIFSLARPALFHGDPHAGNLFLTDDRRLAVLDWSLVGELTETDRVAIVQILLGALALDEGQVVRTLAGMAVRPPVDGGRLRQVVAAALRRIRQGTLPGLAWLTDMLDEAVQTARLRVATNLMLFRKTLHTLTGVVGEVGRQEGQLDEMLTVEFLREFVREWPRRWFSSPDSREFATRLSNWDLTGALLAGPAAVARYWVGQGLDFFAEPSTTGAR